MFYFSGISFLLFGNKKTVWLRLKLKNSDILSLGLQLLCDNNNTNLLTNNLKFYAKTKYINVSIY